MSEIKLTNRTLEILKNFQSINPSMAFRPGITQATVSISRKIMAIADVDQAFDTSFGIYELARFFGAVSIFKDPIISIEKHFINISEDRRSLYYVTCDPRDIPSPSETLSRELPSVDVEFRISEKMIKDALKAAAILNQPNIVFEGDGARIFLTTQNVQKPTNESYKEDVGDFRGEDTGFKIILKTENIKLLPGDYVVKIAFAAKIVQFIGKDVMYFLAAESNSQVFK